MSRRRGGEGGRFGAGQARMFFFEKKPKNFCDFGVCRGAACRSSDKSFLLLFFKKEELVFLSVCDFTRQAAGRQKSLNFRYPW
jgi:hypothetical protein